VQGQKVREGMDYYEIAAAKFLKKLATAMGVQNLTRLFLKYIKVL
jgi:hypothetical protein